MQNLRLMGGILILSAGAALATASCGSSTEKNVTRGDAGAGGEGGERPRAMAGSSPGGSAGTGQAGGGGAAAAGGVNESGGGAGGADDSRAGAGGVVDGGGAGGEPTTGGAAGDGGAGGSGDSAPPPRFRVFNTGVDDQGLALAGGLVDPHFTLIQSPDPTFTGPDAIVTTHIAEGYWLAQSDESKWIAPSPNQSYPGADPCNTQGVYVWRTTFSVAESELAEFTISGGWASDNSGTAVRLNGTPLGALPVAGYSALSAFTIEDGFVAGVNTLDFEVTDIGCPNGLRVELRASVDLPPG